MQRYLIVYEIKWQCTFDSFEVRNVGRFNFVFPATRESDSQWIQIISSICWPISALRLLWPPVYWPLVKVLVAQSCPPLCDPMDYSPPGSCVHGISLARILKWVAIPFSRGSSWLSVWTQVSCIAGRFFTFWATRKASSGKGINWQPLIRVLELNWIPCGVAIDKIKVQRDMGK